MSRGSGTGDALGLRRVIATLGEDARNTGVDIWKGVKMSRILLVSTAAICCLALAVPAFAANTASHTVTVTVAAINELAISGGNITLTINSATAGSDPDDATDSTTCDLAWTTNEASKKITAETDLAAPTFTLKVTATSVSGGTAASEVTLSTTPADFVTGIATTVGSCDLSYVASATAAQGTGSDVHTVLYTLTAA